MSFQDLNVDSRIIKALNELRYTEPTDIQKKAIPVCLEGKDVIAQSMTGSGKTAAFAIPILQKLEPGKGLQAMIIAPTRELANQIAENIEKYAKYMRINVCQVFGGVSIEPQIKNLRYSDILVGTPGRILDHVNRRTVNFSKIKFLVLDEADRMLDMGFIDDIKKIISYLPQNRQTFLFSATLPEEIVYISKRYMKDPLKVSVSIKVPEHKLKEFYCDVRSNDKASLLLHLIRKEEPYLGIIFCATRTTTDFVANALYQNGVEAKAIHGGLTQGQRTRVLEGFHKGKPHILVATDVAARGLDIKNVSHIFNYDIPKSPDDYTHRIGRTARIGQEGKAISLLSNQDHDSFRRIISVRKNIERLVEEDYVRIKIEHREERRPRYSDRPRRRY